MIPATAGAERNLKNATANKNGDGSLFPFARSNWKKRTVPIFAGKPMKISIRSLGLIGLLGGLGGAINAWLCYAGLPVSVGSEGAQPFPLSWFIIPTGYIHGFLLAIISVGFAALLWERNRLLRWLGILGGV